MVFGFGGMYLIVNFIDALILLYIIVGIILLRNEQLPIKTIHVNISSKAIFVKFTIMNCN